ncbi:MFS transporter [Microbacterium sp. NPDC096154]|uniref:MFS transporter n=1 Tax=Microbacterium sp. NPDC096154 TaxID=3155549 RepID=UPI003329DD57
MERTPWGKQALLSSLFFVIGAELYLLTPLIPLIADAFDVDVATAALTVAAYSVTYACVSPIMGVIGDRMTRRSAVVAGAAIFVVGGAISAASPVFAVLIAGRAISGAGGAMIGPTIWAYAAETAIPSERGKATSRVAAIFASGQIVGVPLGSLLAAFASWRWVFVVLAVSLGGLALVILLRLGEEERVPQRNSPFLRSFLTSAQLWRRRRFTFLVVSNLFGQGARNATYAFAGALFALRFDFDVVQIGVLGAAVGLSSLLGALVSGFWIDSFRARDRNPARVNIVNGLLLTGGLVAATLGDQEWVCILGFLVSNFGGSGFISGSQGMLVAAYPHMRASAGSWNTSAMWAGTALGTFVLGGTLLGSVGFAAVSVTMAMLATAAGAAVLLGNRER